MLKKESCKFLILILVKISLVLTLLLGIRCVLTEAIYLRALRPLLASSALIVLSGFFFANQRKYYTSVAVLSGLFCSVLSIKILAQEALTVGVFNELVSFAFGIVNAVLLGFLLLKKSSFSKAIKFCVIVLMFLPIVFLWSYYFSSGSWVSVDTVMAVLQTNLNESKEYISDSMSASGWLRLFILLSFIAAGGFLASGLEKKSALRYGSALIAIFVFANFFFAYRHRKNAVTDIALQARIYTEKYKDFEKQRLARKASLKNELGRIENEGKGIYVLVIGESQNRNNMSAYGYERKTTPWLESIKNDSNFVFFEDVYSCHTHTVPVLTYALTAKNQYNDLELGKSISLLEVVESAGFETVWISNQVKYSAWDTPITVIADEANQQFWHNNNVGEKTATNHYDLKLLDSIEKIKLSDKMLIVFHLMGNHGSYRERYPKEFRKFDRAKTLDEYDNSILYNDYVMQNLFEKVVTLPNFKGMIYFADHADAVLQNLAHDASKFVPEMTHVPMYMYFADAYINEFDEKFAVLNKAKDFVVTNDLIFNTMLSVMDICVESVYEKHNDILSNGYDTDIQRFRTLYGKKKLVDGEM